MKKGIGISLYVGAGHEYNEKILIKAKQAGASIAFTSLHIPEEKSGDYRQEVIYYLALCHEAGISLMIDVGPRTLEKLGLQTLQQLKSLYVTHIRVDYGFSMEEIAALTKDFTVIFNASTLTRDEISELRRYQADFTHIQACHNYYPKPYTALSIEHVKEINVFLHQQEIATMTFVAGDKDLRGPLYEGLPTVEEHRHQDVLLSILQAQQAESDLVLIGDPDVSDKVWQQMADLNQNVVRLSATLNDNEKHLFGTLHHDRPDSSAHVFRSQESRTYASAGETVKPDNTIFRSAGSITISNELFLRYSGELEIARKELPADPRVNVIGHLSEEAMKYLPYLTSGRGIILEGENHE